MLNALIHSEPTCFEKLQSLEIPSLFIQCIQSDFLPFKVLIFFKSLFFYYIN